MKNLFFLIALLSLNFHYYGQEKSCPILPTPVTYQTTNEIISIPKSIIIDTTNLSLNNFNQLKELGKIYHNLDYTTSKEQPLIVFRKLKNVMEDSYSINVAENIAISYCSERSCYYAFHSLMQLIQQNGQELQLNKCFVKDYPNFQWRGLHLDVARHFFTKEEVKRFLDIMAIYKFNMFHWHLTDDQGWRIESKKYPKLTEIGAWRDSTVNLHYSTQPRTYNKVRYGGFYTQEDVKEIVSYAAERFITVVPEIEMPGHARAALAAYPHLSCTGKSMPVESLWGVFDDIFCAKKESIDFLKDLLEEFIPLFPGNYFHIGGDEAPKTRWKKCAKCQEVIATNHLKDEHELQSYFIKQLDVFLDSKGKKLIGWDEILEGGLSPNAAVMSWRGYEGGIEASKLGHEVVMTPGSHCYFDHYQGKSKEEPLAIGGFTPLEKVYDFSPIHPEMNSSQTAYVLGGQANLWTEYIDSFEKLMYMAYPRAIALSQVLWNPTTKPSYEIFEKSLIDNQFPVLKRLNVNYSSTNLYPKVELAAEDSGISLKVSSKKKDDIFHLIFEKPLLIRKNKTSELIFQNNQSFLISRNLGSDTFNFSLHSEHFGVSQSYRVLPHIGLGENIHFKTKPNKQYDSGKLTLVDGQTGSRPWKGHEWIGFDTCNVSIEVTLAKKIQVKELNLSFLHEPGSWIYAPKQITLLWKERTKNLVTTFSLSSGQELISLPFNRKIKSIQIQISNAEKIPSGNPGEGHVPWTFIDEIILR
ncbi:MAG TPA: beta-N-acetylhexosaminidase [Crocinitomicaceae bacterium]|nr:beta-N-acetylhexosaminidase [Crocinitomicaceae bacterium]